MNKLKFYQWVIAGLILSNLFLGFIYFQKNQNTHKGPRDIIIKKLNFDDDQVKKYDELIKQHRKTIREHNQAILRQKKMLYEMLNTKEDPDKVAQITTQIAQLQKEIETIHFHHYQDIKKLTKPSQQKEFQEFANEITNIFPQSKNLKK